MGKQSRKKWLNREQKAEKSIRKNKKLKKLFKAIILILILVIMAGGGYFGYKKYKNKKTAGQPNTTTASQENAANTENKDNQIAVLDTNQGVIKIQLLDSVAPKTVENFVKLAGQGFYDGTKFHRVIKDFMIQGGDPLSRDESKKDSWGTGGPGYKFDDEPVTLTYTRGTVAMANSGANTNGSQFFIMHQDNPTLPKSYTIFGKVIEGMDAVDKIAATPTDSSDRPLSDMIINKITIEKSSASTGSTAQTDQQPKTDTSTPFNIQATDDKGNPINVQATPVK